jgi:hypothetical protein
MKKYNFLIENNDNNQRRKKTSSVDPLLGFGAGLGASSLAATMTAKPLSSYMNDTYTTNGGKSGDYSFLKDVKVNNQPLQKFIDDKKLELDHTNDSPIGPHFNPLEKKINIAGLNQKGSENVGKNILAHELGHSQSMGKSDVMPYLYGASKVATSATALLQLINCFNSDDEQRKKVGLGLSIAGGVSSIPMIAEEINACIVGNELLGIEGADAAKTYIGLPTYIALALSPTIIYGVSEGTRKLLKILRNYKNKDPIANQKVNNLQKQNVKVKIK